MSLHKQGLFIYQVYKSQRGHSVENNKIPSHLTQNKESSIGFLLM